MPDLPNREDYEARLAKGLNKKARKWYKELLELIEAQGSNPRAENIPISFWEGYGGDIKRVLGDEYYRTFLAGARNVISSASINVGDFGAFSFINSAAAQWSQEHAFETSKWITTSTKNIVGSAVSNFYYNAPLGEDLGDLEQRLETLNSLLGVGFSPSRIHTIAVTETTRAAVGGELEVVRRVRASGIPLISIWQTNRDDLVCPICGPRDQGFEGDTWTDPPPAHPGCRCWLDHSLKELEEPSPPSWVSEGDSPVVPPAPAPAIPPGKYNVIGENHGLPPLIRRNKVDGDELIYPLPGGYDPRYPTMKLPGYLTPGDFPDPTEIREVEGWLTHYMYSDCDGWVISQVSQYPDEWIFGVELMTAEQRIDLMSSLTPYYNQGFTWATNYRRNPFKLKFLNNVDDLIFAYGEDFSITSTGGWWNPTKREIVFNGLGYSAKPGNKLRMVEVGWHSQPSTWLHEFGHGFHFTLSPGLSDRDYDLPSWWARAVKKKVSEYGATNTKEFVTEAMGKMVYKKDFDLDDRLWNEYIRVGGPYFPNDPRFIPRKQDFIDQREATRLTKEIEALEQLINLFEGAN